MRAVCLVVSVLGWVCVTWGAWYVAGDITPDPLFHALATAFISAAYVTIGVVGYRTACRKGQL